MMDAEDLWADCEAHPQLLHYYPGGWLHRSSYGINTFLHNKKVAAAEARVIGRLLCGGQGLRGRDPRGRVRVTPQNCCGSCLADGKCEAETLLHFVYVCPAYAGLRATHDLRPLLKSVPEKLLCLHRDQWTWRELRIIRAFLAAAWQSRLGEVRKLRLDLGIGEDLEGWTARRFAALEHRS